MKIIEENSPDSRTVELSSPIRTGASKFSDPDAVSVRCYLAPLVDADVRVRFIAAQSYWHVDGERSEVIEFAGCSYNEKTLMIGRLYFHTDMLIGDTIWPKRAEFLKWADRVFKTVKKLLRYSKAMDAYVGQDADRWRENGGQFVVWIRADGEPIYTTE